MTQNRLLWAVKLDMKMPKGQQLDKGKMRNHITQGEKKVNKKLQKKKIRQTKIDDVPQPNRYSGGWAV